MNIIFYVSKSNQNLVHCLSCQAVRRRPSCILISALGVVEFYLYPTVGTVLIHSIKPELTE